MLQFPFFKKYIIQAVCVTWPSISKRLFHKMWEEPKGQPVEQALNAFYHYLSKWRCWLLAYYAWSLGKINLFWASARLLIINLQGLEQAVGMRGLNLVLRLAISKSCSRKQEVGPLTGSAVADECLLQGSPLIKPRMGTGYAFIS